jgi:ribonuclease HII
MRYEATLRSGGAEIVAGVDEVGIGAWAGPLAVGVVVLRTDKRLYKVRDSKLVDPPRRAWLAERIRKDCVCWGTGLSWPREIDEVGLSEAQRRAARRAICSLTCTPDAYLVDGQWNFLAAGPDPAHSRAVPGTVKTIVRGDCESVSIAAASILAKVVRDRLMAQVAGMFPAYRFDLNKGYPSPLHMWALSALGPSPLHRRLFTPVQKLVDEGIPGKLLPDHSVLTAAPE